jgi:NAD(P)-dependent dehydrogenase (short-subunit alcohol dehydrogenase family)
MSVRHAILIVVGATNGIGLDTTIYLAADSSNNHIIMGARNPTKAEAKLSEVQAKNPKATLSFVQLDQNDDESIAAAVKKIEQDFGRLDVLVNNAGVCPENNTQEWTTRDTLRATFETNVPYSKLPRMPWSSTSPPASEVSQEWTPTWTPATP